MELWQMRYFYAVATMGNLSRAARALNMTQPALSAAITKLEDELNCQLFDRYKGRIFLSSAGRELMRYVPGVLKSVEDLTAAMGPYNQNRHAMLPIRVGGTDLRLLQWLMRAYMQEAPGAIFSCDCRDEGQLSTDLENERLDFAIAETMVGSHLCWTPILTERVVLYMPKGHPLSEKETVYKADLRDIDFVQLRTAASADKPHPYDFQPRIRLQTNDAGLALESVGEGVGVSLLPERVPMLYASPACREAVCRREVQDFREVRTLGIVFKKGVELIDTAQRAFDFMANALIQAGK